MGCGNSKSSPGDTLLELAPTAPGLQQPVPSLDRDTLNNALRNVARYLHSKNAQVTIISVGGAVNTIFLQSRASTHDVDFYNQALTKRELQLIVSAARYAQSKDPTLQNEWINNRTILFIPLDRRQILTSEAISQNEVIFNERGLKVLAAPWHYACAAKLDRIAGSSPFGTQPYDMADASDYLHRWLVIQRRDTVRQSEVEAWARTYGTRISAEVIRAMDAEHGRRYRRSAIQFGV